MHLSLDLSNEAQLTVTQDDIEEQGFGNISSSSGVAS